VDGSGSGLCPVVGFSFSDVEHSGNHKRKHIELSLLSWKWLVLNIAFTVAQMAYLA